MQQASGFTFLIRENTFLRQISGLDDVYIEAARAVEAVGRERGGKTEYEARRCCLKTDPDRCIYKHRFRILDRNLDEIKTAEARATLSDSFINATVGCTLTQALKKWNRQNTGDKHEVQNRNMWHAESWGIHATHEIRDDHGGAQGTCFDIRPLSKNSRREALDHRHYSRYDRGQTRAFLKLIKQAGADTIILNESRVRERTNSRNIRRHDDHVHIYFNPNSETVKDACRNGI